MLAPTSLNIEVVVAGTKPGSVKMALTGAATINRIEGGTFSLCANSGSDFKPCKNLVVGKYSLKADLLTGASGTGQVYGSATVAFELRSGSAPFIPVAAPIKPPVQAPVMPPVTAPVMPPVQAPVLAPVVPSSSCNVPKVSIE
jgi:hypothetical protein